MAGQYDSLTREQLAQLLEKRDRQKKLGLVWERDEIEADKAVDANFVACSIIRDLCEGETPWQNFIIEGDNYDALRWLRMGFAGRIKCIYIDPPYNTGNKDWVYNDHYLDSSDRYRHSTWLEFIYRRMLIARDLLSDDGVIFVSINDDNRARLDLLIEEVMPGSRVGSFVWRTKDTANDADRNFSAVHEHVLIYARKGFSFLGHKLASSKYKNPDNDPRGIYTGDPLTKAHSYRERPNTYYPIQDPESGWWYPCSPDRVWAYASQSRTKPGQRLRADTIEALIADRRVIFPAKEYVLYASREELLRAIRNGTAPKDGNGRQLLREDLPDLDFWIGKPIAIGRPSKKSFWEEKKSKIKPVSSYILGTKETKTEELHELSSEKQGKATGEIQELFGSKAFDFPKPSSLIISLLNSAVGPGEMVLDFFAGSATTAQAVMELNAEDEGNRRFIMVSSTEATAEEPEKNLCRDVCAKRIRLVNDSGEGKYDELSAGFAYLRTKIIRFEDFDYDLLPAETWAVLEAVHDLSLTVYDSSRPWNTHATESVVLIYVENFDLALIQEVERFAAERRSIFIYTWTPGLIAPYVANLDIELHPVRETLVKRFQQ